MHEGRLERRLKREVEKLGGKALKFNCSGMSGVPDRLILIPQGKVVFVEMKSTGKKLRPLQQKRKRDLEQLGFNVYAIDSELAIDNFIQDVFVENA